MLVNERRLFLGMFFVVLAIIAWGDVTNCSGLNRLPWPPRIVMTAIVFGMLDLLSGILGTVAPLVGVGFVIAAVINKEFTHTDCDKRLAAGTQQPSAVLDAFNQSGSTGVMAT